MAKLKVGDTVMWKGSFGMDPAKKVTIESIEINTHGGKEGDSVEECDWNKVTRDNCVVNLSNDHWAYGNQISRMC
jgi:hypothetical protein